MNSDNLSYLKAVVAHLGFGDNGSLMDELSGAVEKQSDEFVLDTEAFFDEETILSSTLFFRRSVQFNMYFFMRYEAELHYINNPAKDRAQTFHITNGTGITQKEAFNLLQGRSVNKNLTDADGEKYNAWIQLNFEKSLPSGNYETRQFRSRFDLKKTLLQYPIRECQQDESMTGLIRSLQRGNRVPVDFVKPRKTEKMYIEANPLYKTINIYPVKMESPRNNPE